MNKKHAIFCFAAVFLLGMLLFSISSLVLADTSELNITKETQQVNKAYTWLSDEVRGDWQDLSVEDNSLALLALAWDDALASEGYDSLNSKSKDEEKECWPSPCRIRETAFSILALSRLGRNTESIEDWIMMQNSTPSELKWFMQIDSMEEATCTISYKNYNYNVTLSEDKKINKDAGSCLGLSYGNYWFKVSKTCYERTFTITCDEDFVATLFYQKPDDPGIYISSDTKRESAGGSADLRINAVCLGDGGKCDYEATAWAAISMLKNRDISVFLPYLVGYAEQNAKLLPDAFLYILTGQEDYANSLISQKRKTGYWSVGSKYGKYYDTALALLALEDYDAEVESKAKEWLLGEQVPSGTDEGSWGSSKKDTAFILYALWPKEATFLPKEEFYYCSDYGYYCVPSYDCDFDLRIADYYCSGMQVCCKAKPEEKLRTCNEIGGLFCGRDEICVGTTTSATDGICCLGACRTEEEGENECEDEGYTCQYACSETEEEIGFDCSGTKVCCATASGKPKKGKAWLWVLIIFLLVIAGALIFLFRDKLKDKWMKLRGGRRGPPGKMMPGPRFPPAGGAGARGIRPVMPMPARMQPGMLGRLAPKMPIRPASPLGRQAIKRFAFKKTPHDKELEETLKKLRDVGK